jgi:hypothetical protein
MNSSQEAPGFEPLPETVMLGCGKKARSVELHKFRELCGGPNGAKAGDHGAYPYLCRSWMRTFAVRSTKGAGETEWTHLPAQGPTAWHDFCARARAQRV